MSQASYISLLVVREQGIDRGELKQKQECEIISGTVFHLVATFFFPSDEFIFKPTQASVFCFVFSTFSVFVG